MKLTRRGFLAALVGAILGRFLPKKKTPAYPHIDGATKAGNVIQTAGWSGSPLVKGDVFTIEGVHSINPRTLQSTGHRHFFVVTDVTGETATLKIHPPIIPTGPYRNVSRLPAHRARITPFVPYDITVEAGPSYTTRRAA